MGFRVAGGLVGIPAEGGAIMGFRVAGGSRQT